MTNGSGIEGRGPSRGRKGGGRRRELRVRGIVLGASLGFLGAVASSGSAQVTPAAGAAPDTAGRPTITLTRAVGLALGQSRQIRVARYALEEADERVDEAWGAVYPAVDFTMNYTRNVSPAVNFLPAVIFDPSASPDEQIAVPFGSDNTWAGSFDVTQPLFKPGVIIGVGAAARYRELQEEVLRGEVESVVTDVRTAFYQLLLAQEQARLTENSVRRLRETLTETQALNRAGLAADYDVLRLEVELANIEPNLRRARNAVMQARRQIGVVLDVEFMEEAEVAGSLATMDLSDPHGNSPANQQILEFAGVEFEGAPPAGAADELVADAFDRRSDLRQLELTENLRQAELRLEQAAYLPEVSLFGNYSVNAQQNGAPEFFGEPRAYGRRVGVLVTFPIFTGLARNARIDQKSAALEAARTQTDLARSRTRSQVKTLLDQVEEALSRARAQRFAVSQAERGFDIARAQFREGMGSQLEMTDAEVALRQSEFNYAQAVYDYLTARADLDAATGRVPMVEGLRHDEGRRP